MSKKFYCFALFIVMLLSIASVTASEDVSDDINALESVEAIDVQSTQIEDISDDLSTNYADEIISNSTAELDPDLNINVTTENEFVTVISTVNENATGNVSIQIKSTSDENYTDFGNIEIENGTATWADFVPFDKGTYIVNATYSGDETYVSTSTLKEFEIEKYIPDLDVNITTENEFVTIVTTLNQNATGNVTIRIRSTEEENYTEMGTIEIENGTATWADFVPFDKGTYVAYTTYTGDDNYFNKTDTQTFEIEKYIPDFNVNITTNNAFVTIETTIDANATGNVTIRIRSTEEENYTEMGTIEIENGTATWADFVPFDKGTYVAYTTYTGDDNYFNKTDTQTFEIDKEISELNVTIEVDDFLIILNATVNPNATGTITINTKTFEEDNFTEMATIELENGTATWADFEPFDKGNYVAYVVYNGDDNYFSTASTQTFEIEKYLADLNVNITTDDEFVTIVTTLNENATGNVTINIKSSKEENYTEMATIELENGTATWADLEPFEKGDYVAYVTYTGDDNYFSGANTQIFEVGKEITELNVTIEVNDCFVVLNATVNPNATGTITINIKSTEEDDYTEMATIELENGTATWADLVPFDKGTYVAYTQYSGDEDYFRIADTQTFEIEKQIPEFSVNITTDNAFVTIETTINENATGNVTINIKTFEEDNFTEIATIEIENGTATWADFEPFAKGDYVAYVTYSGDDNYFKIGNTQTFTIEKDITDLNVTIEVNDCFVVLNATVNPNATGTITINTKTFEEENYTEMATIELENGTATWADFVSFDKGDYVAYVTYSGDDNYFSRGETLTFTIEKQFPEFSVNITTENEFVTIETTIDENATGNVTINIRTFEEENYTEIATIEIENGTATWADFEPFAKGDYVAYVTYSGDDNYFKTGNTQTFTIEKDITDLNVTIEVNMCFITLNATVNPNATGTITINTKTFEEDNYTEMATIELENGTATWADFVSFDKGDYVAYVTYSGDDNYFSRAETLTFTIEKQMPNLIIEPEVNGTTCVINISLPENATGTVSVINNATGVESNFTLNGTNISVTTSLTVGDNIITVKYSGDDYYFETQTTFDEIIKEKTVLSTTSSKIKVVYALDTSVTVELNAKVGNWTSPVSNEEVSVIINNKTYTGTVKDGSVVINITAKFVPNTYTAQVLFEGSDRLENASTTFTFVVKKATPKLTAKNAKYKLKTKTKKYKIALKTHKNTAKKNTKVILKVNGKKYKATTNSKGKATFKITNLKKKAKYIALITYSGSKYYNEVSKKVKIKVK